MCINLISGLVKPGDQALISISTILKFSAQMILQIIHFTFFLKEIAIDSNFRAFIKYLELKLVDILLRYMSRKLCLCFNSIRSQWKITFF